MKKIFALLLTLAMILSLAACGAKEDAPAKGDTYEIGYVNLADTDVFCMARETALNEVVAGTNFSVSYTDGNNDNQKQLDQTNAFLAKGVDALILVPADSDAIVPAIEAANGNNTPVICLGIAANGGDFVFVGSQNYDAGYMQGEYMAEALPENANVLYCAGTAGLFHSIERREGFLAALEEKGRTDITVLADQDGDYVKDEAMRICDAWIQSFGDGAGGVTFDAIICANDQMALGCMESLRGAGLLTEVFAAESKNYISPAFYETLFTTRYTSDDESKDMLDIVIKSEIIDLDQVFQWGHLIMNAANAADANNTSISSLYTKYVRAAGLKLEKTLDIYAELDNYN